MVLFALTSSSSSSKLKQHSHRSFSESLMEDSIEDAEAIIHQWISPDSSSSSSSSFCCTFSLFSNKNREEAKQFMGAVTTLHSAMVKLISANPASTKLIRAESLLKTSMNHLSKENASKEDDDAEAMADLKMIADCMTSSGYGKECFTIYKKIRKSIIVEALEQLGFENLTLSQVQKLEWQSTEKKTRVWLRAVRKAVTTLFFGERILSDHVFSSSAAIRESSFAEITLQSALALFSFPGNVAKSRKTPEKIFLTLDVYQSIVELMPRIEEVFSYDSTSSVKSQIAGTLANLEEAVVSMIDEFESSISNESSKSVISNGGIHQLTRYVMNYIVFLADYSDTLANIIPETSSFASPEEDESTSSSSLSSPLAKRISSVRRISRRF
ncbi:BnaCnng37160D [Brassica napus]|uniref:Exocyst subunit Exo70 family protein n=1 Tax=Brassica napus TaxID=3708 RepID=A0A078JAL5_BRANA|nr:BnaCnng37160D [Brassica napus]